MSNRLGRNPFEAKATAKPVRARKPLPEAPASSDASPSSSSKKSQGLLGWALVDVPAETFVFGLKILMLARSTWDRKRG